MAPFRNGGSSEWRPFGMADPNRSATGVSGVPPPEIAVHHQNLSFHPPPGNDVPSPFWGKSLKLLQPEVRF